MAQNRAPVADISAPTEEGDPWVSSEVLRAIVREASADSGLMSDLAEVRGVHFVEVIRA